ncbi:hypothetical protein SO802_006380 [Lithocarpus litseifolius]|uniref:Uncharacterized protein n=1 Tax=Lithocarpus litseifolius TaxID=425828 RepID=A0AAW2DKQ0_9ROSI
MGHFSYGKNRTAPFSIANILALTLCRSESFLLVFWLAVKFLGRSWARLHGHAIFGIVSVSDTGTVRRVPIKVLAASSHATIVKFDGGVIAGSGICVFLSFLLQPCSVDVRLIWVAKGIEQNFGKEIEEMESGWPKDKVIVHGTAVFGRLNVSQLSIDAARNWNTEVVIVTSNLEGSRDVVNACKATGISAFGPTWDS